MKGRTPLLAFKAGIKLSKVRKEPPKTETPSYDEPAAA